MALDASLGLFCSTAGLRTAVGSRGLVRTVAAPYRWWWPVCTASVGKFRALRFGFQLLARCGTLSSSLYPISSDRLLSGKEQKCCVCWSISARFRLLLRRNGCLDLAPLPTSKSFGCDDFAGWRALRDASGGAIAGMSSTSDSRAGAAEPVVTSTALLAIGIAVPPSIRTAQAAEPPNDPAKPCRYLA